MYKLIIFFTPYFSVIEAFYFTLDVINFCMLDGFIKMHAYQVGAFLLVSFKF